jgi:hypothetical protein
MPPLCGCVRRIDDNIASHARPERWVAELACYCGSVNGSLRLRFLEPYGNESRLFVGPTRASQLAPRVVKDIRTLIIRTLIGHPLIRSANGWVPEAQRLSSAELLLSPQMPITCLIIVRQRVTTNRSSSPPAKGDRVATKTVNNFDSLDRKRENYKSWHGAQRQTWTAIWCSHRCALNNREPLQPAWTSI